MSEVNQCLAHRLVQIDTVSVLQLLADDFSVLILDNEDLFWLRHSRDHYLSHLGKNWKIELSPCWYFLGQS